MICPMAIRGLPPRGESPAARLRAFTLVESLITVGIITVLAMMLMPFAKDMVARSGKSRCLANLRSIGAAVHLYAAENNMNLPPGNSDGQEWFIVNYSKSWLKEYGADGSESNARKLLRCPTDRTKSPITDYKNYYSYAFNSEQLLSYLDGVPAFGRAPVKLHAAQRKILFTDGVSNAEDPDKVKKYPFTLSADKAIERISIRHENSANCLFGDGSVIAMPREEAAKPALLIRE